MQSLNHTVWFIRSGCSEAPTWAKGHVGQYLTNLLKNEFNCEFESQNQKHGPRKIVSRKIRGNSTKNTASL